jgi:hypothetical protein
VSPVRYELGFYIPGDSILLSRLGVCGRIAPTEIAAPAKPGSMHYWEFSKAHIGPRFACGFPNSLRI